MVQTTKKERYLKKACIVCYYACILGAILYFPLKLIDIFAIDIDTLRRYKELAFFLYAGIVFLLFWMCFKHERFEKEKQENQINKQAVFYYFVRIYKASHPDIDAIDMRSHLKNLSKLIDVLPPNEAMNLFGSPECQDYSHDEWGDAI
jgi:hypothetical protein